MNRQTMIDTLLHAQHEMDEGLAADAVGDVIRQLAAEEPYAVLQNRLLESLRDDLVRFMPAHVKRGQMLSAIDDALAKNPNPAGHPTAEASHSLTGEASGPVGLGPDSVVSGNLATTELVHEIVRLNGVVDACGECDDTARCQNRGRCTKSPFPVHAVGTGFATVPIEPTPEMMEAGYRAVGASHYSPTAEKLQGWGELAAYVYRAMLDAAPQPVPSQFSTSPNEEKAPCVCPEDRCLYPCKDREFCRRGWMREAGATP